MNPKKLIITFIMLLPIIALAAYTVVANLERPKTQTIDEGTITNRLPSEIVDEIADSIQQDDFETAFVKIEELLADPNIPTSRGTPLLGLAADKGSYDLAALLLAKGADANLHDINSGETALIKAARRGDINLMNLLIVANGDTNAQTLRGVSVLTAAIQNGDPALLEFLLSRGARVGGTAENMFNYAFQKSTVGVDAMLKTGVDPNAVGKDGNTALIIAASYGDLPTAQVLVTYKANVNAANNAGMTPLLYAVQTQNQPMADFLIEKGADVNKLNNKQEGPLFWAAYFGNTQLVDNLLKLGADYKQVSAAKFTPLQIAQRNKRTETAKLLSDFIAYKNIPRDDKGRPIIPKAAPAAQTAPPPAKPAQTIQAAAPSAPTPPIPGLTPEVMQSLPPEAAAALAAAQQQQGAPAQTQAPSTPAPKPGVTQPSKLRLSQ